MKKLRAKTLTQTTCLFTGFLAVILCGAIFLAQQLSADLSASIIHQNLKTAQHYEKQFIAQHQAQNTHKLS